MRAIFAIITFMGILSVLAMPAMGGDRSQGISSRASCMHAATGEFQLGSTPQSCCVWLEGKLAVKKQRLNELKHAREVSPERIEGLTSEVEELESRISLEKRAKALSPADFFYGYPVNTTDACNC